MTNSIDVPGASAVAAIRPELAPETCRRIHITADRLNGIEAREASARGE